MIETVQEFFYQPLNQYCLLEEAFSPSSDAYSSLSSFSSSNGSVSRITRHRYDAV